MAVHGDHHTASCWVTACLDDLRPGGRALDLACGRGRNALELARGGWLVTAVDRDLRRLGDLGRRACEVGGRLDLLCMDLERGEVTLGSGQFDLVVVTRYLHRPVFGALKEALAPGGSLVYETFTVSQAERGRPRSPEFLLQHGELLDLVKPLEIVRSREGDDEDGNAVASVLARKKDASRTSAPVGF